MTAVELAAILAAAVVGASMLSVELGISVALLELGLGMVLGNVFGLNPDQSWLVFVASFASVVLRFLAGAEVDPDHFRERFGASVTIGVVSFAGPLLAAWLLADFALGWTLKASLIAGTALSTTSLAVVYAVLVETGLNSTRVGKLLVSALARGTRDRRPGFGHYSTRAPTEARRSRGPHCHLTRLGGPLEAAAVRSLYLGLVTNMAQVLCGPGRSCRHAGTGRAAGRFRRRRAVERVRPGSRHLGGRVR